MEEPLVIKALRDKRAEIHRQIAAYQVQIAQAKHDLAHVNATIRMFTNVECHARATCEPRLLHHNYDLAPSGVTERLNHP